jgi:hypothetical protein
MNQGLLLGLVFPLVFIGVPLGIGLVGWRRCRIEPPPREDLAPRRLSLQSLLAYALAFNITFFIQELFLVVPKALTPGLRPTLYHNNHRWEGSHPLESLFQGTGVAAILVSGLIFAWLARRGAGATEAKRLFVLWMAYHGLFQALPQVAFAAAAPGSDSGQALDWFGLVAGAELVVSAAGMVAIVLAGLFMTARFLELGPPMTSGRQRNTFVFFAAILPAVLAIPLVILFRVPREWTEVVIPAIAVPVIGLIWVQSTAWRNPVSPRPPAPSTSLAEPIALVIGLLLVFHLVLRPGIAFY